ncbi:MAG: 4-deoxy-4-formamido-L-arabinose-phosphoundecaprenol deformylase, partial [Armatimonadota bacterium]
ESLRYHDERGLLYASDTRRGAGAFRPRIGDETFRTPQLPTNLPTLDEMWGLTAHSQAEVAQVWLGLLEPDSNVLTIHTEMEGMALTGLLEEFVAAAREREARFCPLRELVTGAELPVREIGPGRLPGRAGKVWIS